MFALGKPNEKTLRQICLADDSAIEKLHIYVRLLLEWQKAINLVAPSTLPHIWDRHIIDSAQLWPLITAQNIDTTIADFGSGGGLPALVLAMMGARHVTAIESDKRKAIFMREVSRETGLQNFTVINSRIEAAPAQPVNFVTARALASLGQLLYWVSPWVGNETMGLFLKGQDYQAEIDALTIEQQQNIKQIESIQSLTDDKAHIVAVYYQDKKG